MDLRIRPTRVVSVVCTALLVTLLVLPLEASGRIRGFRVVATVEDNQGFMGVDGTGVLQLPSFGYIGRYSVSGERLADREIPPEFYAMQGFGTGADGDSYYTYGGADAESSRVYRISSAGGDPTLIYSTDNSTEFHILGDVAVGSARVYFAEVEAAHCDPTIEGPGSCENRPPPRSLIRHVGKSGGAAGAWEVSVGDDIHDVAELAYDRATDEIYAGIDRNGFQVDRYLSSGTRMSSWGQWEDGEGNFQGPIQSIAVDGQGRVWVSSRCLCSGGGAVNAGVAQSDESARAPRLQLFTKGGTFLSGFPPFLSNATLLADLVAYDGRIFGLEGIDKGSRIIEFGDTPDLNVEANARWRQEKRKVVVNTNCNVPCRTDVDTYLKIGKKREYLRLKRSDTYTAKRQFFTFRLSRRFRKMVNEAHAQGKKVRVLAGVFASQVSEFEPIGAEDQDCQVVAIPRPRANAAAKCSRADQNFFFG